MAARRGRLALLAALAALALSACGEQPTTFHHQSVVVSPSGSFPGGRGNSVLFTANLLNLQGETVSNSSFGWVFTSSNPAVIEITPEGQATAKTVGTATITARAGSFEGSTTITVTQIPNALNIVTGDKQAGVVGKALTTQASLKVVDAGGQPIAGRAVRFKVTSGGGTVSPDSVLTGADGIAKATWTLGTSTTAKQTLSASTDDFTTVLTATPQPDVPATVTVLGGNNQTGWALEAVDSALVVAVADKYGNPVPGATVAWSVTGGGGSVAPASAATTANGRTTTTWTLGSATGAQTARAVVGSLAPAAFTATAQPNAIITGTVTVGSGSLVRSAFATAAPARRPSARAPSVPAGHVAREWIVTFAPATASVPSSGVASLVSPTSASQALEARVAALQPAGSFVVAGVSPSLLAARVRVGDGADWEAIGRQLRTQPGVRSVEPNRLAHRVERSANLTALAPTADPYYPMQAWHYEMIGLDQAWKLTTGSNTVTVAVVDDGTRYDHANLTDNLTHDGYDFVSEDTIQTCIGSTVLNAGDGGGYDNDPTQPSAYNYDVAGQCVSSVAGIAGQGVQEAGLIGAATGKNGAVGVNWSVKVRPVRVIGVAGLATDYDIAQGILYAAGLPADNGTGGTVTAPSRSSIIDIGVAEAGPPSAVLTNAVQAASAAGSLLIAPAGDGGNVDRYPAAFPEVLSVTSVDPTGAIPLYANAGAGVDLAAPGGDQSLDDTRGVLSTGWNFGAASATWVLDQGTALAAAHAAGVAALLLAREPTLTAAQLRSRLLDYATPITGQTVNLLNAFGSLNRGADFRHDVYVRAVDANTGAIKQTVKAGSNGSFRFSRLPIGTAYVLYAGQDEEGDAAIGTLGRVWGALGGSAHPTPIAADSTGVYTASFSVALPIESGTNLTSLTPDVLTVGGYLNGELKQGEEDWYTITVPAGTYTFATAGLMGGCGLALQANTSVDLYDSVGLVIATNDDGTGFDYCGKVTQALLAGTYKLRVKGSTSVTLRAVDQAFGKYRVYVR